jgi:hypothetical protein
MNPANSARASDGGTVNDWNKYCADHPEVRTGRFLVNVNIGSAGRIEYSLELSKRRAAAVRTYLVTKYGVSVDWIIAVIKTLDVLIEAADSKSVANKCACSRRGIEAPINHR